MSLPFPTSRAQLPAEKPAIVQMVTREDMTWNRPIFRAPPLRVEPPVVDATAFPFPAALIQLSQR
jgi:hypothetical protein